MAFKSVNPAVDSIELIESLLELLPADVGNILRLFKLTSIHDLIERVSSLDFPSSSDIQQSSSIALGQGNSSKRSTQDIEVIPSQRKRSNYQVRQTNVENESGSQEPNSNSESNNNTSNNGNNQQNHKKYQNSRNWRRQ